ncbi:N-acetylglucosaminyltransferase II [Dictyocaulus viviparus]|uniref:Alpha-1,6-mannosyl-glycoprotein 2-beta-N-acetylglucosaminyltransferase n=1 Tax=Dictyocaulus viviparus TaxID=29172 RepID=A0A0D8XJW0_DICVI|nr:N-acetylglucosaminyltransferase II [Dictyocaulus viviparus]
MFYRRSHRILNIIISICLIGFLVVVLKGPSTDSVLLQIPSFPSPLDTLRTIKEMEDDSLNDSISDYGGESDLAPWPFHSSYANMTISGEEIVLSVDFLNENFDLLNLAKFGPVENVKIVIVIQVHNRPNYLAYLINSLRHAKGIEETLLVFSHDINVTPVNEMIRNITFARVIQIYYPYNMQIFPHVFPGQDPRDCPERVGKEAAFSLKCKNAGYPDKYGNYRVAKITQVKHHWWWKMNYVFDGIFDRFELTEAWVLLLEEDHYVVQDALYVLNNIIQNRERYCVNCEIISLGFYLKSFSRYGLTIAHLGAHPWYSSRHNMGMAFRRESWLKVKNCSELFCKYDDYNWDWSLMQVSSFSKIFVLLLFLRKRSHEVIYQVAMHCLPKRFRVIFTKSPRVIHIGDCGLHTHRCNAHNTYMSIRSLLETHTDLFFPSRLVVSDVSQRSPKPSKANGGWGDIRDHALCRANTYPLNKTSHEIPELRDLMHTSVHIGTSTLS